MSSSSNRTFQYTSNRLHLNDILPCTGRICSPSSTSDSSPCTLNIEAHFSQYSAMHKNLSCMRCSCWCLFESNSNTQWHIKRMNSWYFLTHEDCTQIPIDTHWLWCRSCQHLIQRMMGNLTGTWHRLRCILSNLWDITDRLHCCHTTDSTARYIWVFSRVLL